MRDTDNADYLVKQGFAPCTPEKMIFIGDSSKNLFVYEAINGGGIMEAELRAYCTTLTFKTWLSTLEVSCLKVLVSLT